MPCDDTIDGDDVIPFAIEIDIASELWPSGLWLRQHIYAAIEAALAQIKSYHCGELSVVFTDNMHIKQLNCDYRGKDRPTYVLAFPTPFPQDLQGDIILAYETIADEAAQQHKPLSNHLLHLLIHGFYHLQGYAHQEIEAAQAMEALEIAALAQLGIDNPYQSQKKQ